MLNYATVSDIAQPFLNRKRGAEKTGRMADKRMGTGTIAVCSPFYCKAQARNRKKRNCVGMIFLPSANQYSSQKNTDYEK